MNKIPFENGTIVTPAKVTINEVEYEVTPAEYTGETPLSAENLNQMQDNVETAINEQTTHKYFMKVTAAIAKRRNSNNAMQV